MILKERKHMPFKRNGAWEPLTKRDRKHLPKIYDARSNILFCHKWTAKAKRCLMAWVPYGLGLKKYDSLQNLLFFFTFWWNLYLCESNNTDETKSNIYMTLCNIYFNPSLCNRKHLQISYTHTHTRIYSNIFTYIQKYVNIYTYIHTQNIYIHTFMHTHKHTSRIKKKINLKWKEQTVCQKEYS